jgi:hypothetical protein
LYLNHCFRICLLSVCLLSLSLWLQMQMDYEEAAAHYEIVVTAEAQTMPRNWIGRVVALKRLMKCLALGGSGDTPRFRELERDATRILVCHYGTVGARSCDDWVGRFIFSSSRLPLLSVAYIRSTPTTTGRRRRRVASP